MAVIAIIGLTIGLLPLRHGPLPPLLIRQPQLPPPPRLVAQSFESEPAAEQQRQPPIKSRIKKPPPPLILLPWQKTLSGLVALSVLMPLRTSGATRFMKVHILVMTLMLPLGMAAISTVRQRKIPPRTPPPGGAQGKKRRAEILVIRHFLASAAALYGSFFGLVAVYRHKVLMGRPHLTTPHSWLGLAAVGTWLAAYLAAQPHVWRDQIKARKFSLFSNKRWLWADATHRRLGTAAFVLFLCAFCSGMLGWAVLDPRIARLGSVAIVAIGISTYSEQIREKRRKWLRRLAAKQQAKLLEAAVEEGSSE